MGAVLPVPFRGTVTAGFVGSLLVMFRLPAALPDVAGEKVSTTWADWPAGIVFGVFMPLKLKSGPESASTEIVKSAAPELVIKTLLFIFNPVETVPKLTLVGLTDICG